MLNISFDSLPDRARTWVFASDRPIVEARAERLLAEVDAFLGIWAAHGTPLVCASRWVHDRFLVVAVDEEATGASGCSIDGLFRALQRLEAVLGATLTDRSLVFFRNRDGRIQSTTRDAFSDLARSGDVDGQTPVFDPTVTTLGAWRTRFEVPSASTWHAQLLPAPAA
ncbi:MAG: hypothetical protein NVS1B4_20930 [Gemmatimonadaceae bacterium]